MSCFRSTQNVRWQANRHADVARLSQDYGKNPTGDAQRSIAFMAREGISCFGSSVDEASVEIEKVVGRDRLEKESTITRQSFTPSVDPTQ